MDTGLNLSIFNLDALFADFQLPKNCSHNESSKYSTNKTFNPCSDFDEPDSFKLRFDYPIHDPPLRRNGTDFFAYFTPAILVVGIVGNCLSLAVFVSKNMRKSPASIYLAALSLADTSTLIFYVLIEWFRRGLVHVWPDHGLTFLEYNGVCHVLLFLAYVSRVMSAWIIVIFTIERFTGVCYPMKRFKRGAKKIILIMLIVASIVVLYKPVLSGSYKVRGRIVCSSNPSHQFVSFILDSTYAISITLIPFLIITILNVLIVRKLFLRNKRRRDILTEDTKIKQIKLEFTFILLAISVFFIAFNLPFITVWSRVYLKAGIGASDMPYWADILNTTRTIFCMNYCINFFLYSITGARFRSELYYLFLCQSRRKRRFKSSYIRSTRLGSTSTHVTLMHCSSSSHFSMLNGAQSISTCTTYSA